MVKLSVENRIIFSLTYLIILQCFIVTTFRSQPHTTVFHPDFNLYVTLRHENTFTKSLISYSQLYTQSCSVKTHINLKITLQSPALILLYKSSRDLHTVTNHFHVILIFHLVPSPSDSLKWNPSYTWDQESETQPLVLIDLFPHVKLKRWSFWPFSKVKILIVDLSLLADNLY